MYFMAKIRQKILKGVLSTPSGTNEIVTITKRGVMYLSKRNLQVSKRPLIKDK